MCHIQLSYLLLLVECTSADLWSLRRQATKSNVIRDHHFTHISHLSKHKHPHAVRCSKDDMECCFVCLPSSVIRSAQQYSLSFLPLLFCHLLAHFFKHTKKFNQKKGKCEQVLISLEHFCPVTLPNHTQCICSRILSNRAPQSSV